MGSIGNIGGAASAGGIERVRGVRRGFNGGEVRGDSMNDFRSCIHQVPIFQTLPEESILRLQRAMHHRKLSPGEVVISTGDPVNHMIVVAKGLLKLVKVGSSGREQVVRELGPGEFFGEMGLFTSMVAEADLVAVTETDACLLRRDAVESELASHPEVALRLVEALAKRLADAERTIGEIALMDVGQRLASELLRLCRARAEAIAKSPGRYAGPGSGASSGEGHFHGDPGKEAVTFELPYSWAEMASRLATTPESLSRRLRSLVDDGIVDVNGRTVTVRDLRALEERTLAL